ncbi:unnamed protein product [Protopolystoma xenopodis]|uniref:Uncharacterized protein n=1 Tax=Protopolystoma xenopodis TaxID=117903 RepID=A0A448WU56_9PLAT|nr:unnamed protein product [Protopolystoma xenopodis]
MSYVHNQTPVEKEREEYNAYLKKMRGIEDEIATCQGKQPTLEKEYAVS